MDEERAKIQAMISASEEIAALFDMLPLRHQERDQMCRNGASDEDLHNFDVNTKRFADHVSKRSAALRVHIPIQ